MKGGGKQGPWSQTESEMQLNTYTALASSSLDNQSKQKELNGCKQLHNPLLPFLLCPHCYFESFPFHDRYDTQAGPRSEVCIWKASLAMQWMGSTSASSSKLICTPEKTRLAHVFPGRHCCEIKGGTTRGDIWSPVTRTRWEVVVTQTQVSIWIWTREEGKQQQPNSRALACGSREATMPHVKAPKARPQLPSQRYQTSTWLMGDPQQVSVEQVHATQQNSKCLNSRGYWYQPCHFSGPQFVFENMLYVTEIPIYSV